MSMMMSHDFLEYLTRTATRAGGQVAMAELNELESRAARAVHFNFGDCDEIPTAPQDMLDAAGPPFPVVMGQFLTPGHTHYSCTISLFERTEGFDWILTGAKQRDGKWVCLSPTVWERDGDGQFLLSARGYDANYEPRLQHYAQMKNAFAVIACSNVETVAHPAPAALNRKRAKAGKVPIFEHRTLVLSGGGGSKGAPNGGTHASPRVHLRRGHIRRLPGKTVWVQACVVGDKSRGVVSKDYAVKASVHR